MRQLDPTYSFVVIQSVITAMLPGFSQRPLGELPHRSHVGFKNRGTLEAVCVTQNTS